MWASSKVNIVSAPDFSHFSQLSAQPFGQFENALKTAVEPP